MSSNALIVFVKNTSDVKTRIAVNTSTAQANEIYNELLLQTSMLCNSLVDIDIIVYYSSDFLSSDNWPSKSNAKQIQASGDLGAKMLDAFTHTLKNYTKVIIIGSDCPYITNKDLNFAFHALSKADIVIGPARDGGYYLIGMKTPHPQLFNNIKWSTESVYSKTIDAVFSQNNSLQVLRQLSDIDVYEDYLEWKNKQTQTA